MPSLPPTVRVLARGWLHGNCVILGGARPALIDTGYHSGVDALEAAIVEHLGRLEELERIVLTHVHSDHAGGVAGLCATHPVPVAAHADAARLIRGWDRRGLWLAGTGQKLPRFRVDRLLVPGAALRLGDRDWQVVATPGHATGGVAFFAPEGGLLVSGDALWEDGFGVLDPWVDGPGVFDAAARALAQLAALPVQVVIPGHGPPFRDFAGALERARSRLEYLRARPESLRRQVVRVGVTFYALAHPDADEATLQAAMRGFAAAHCERPEQIAPLCAAVAEAMRA